MVDLLNGGLHADLIQGRFAADLGEERATDAVGFHEGRGLGVAAGEVRARGTFILESFQFLQCPLQRAFMA